MTEALMRHAYTIPHGGPVTSVSRAAAAIILVLVAKGVPFPVLLIDAAEVDGSYTVTVHYKGDRL
jgi:hypothetical protein